MLSRKQFGRRLSSIASTLVLVLAGGLPVLLHAGQASAVQLTNRKITIGTSKANAADVTYSVSFKQVTAATIKGVVVEFCDSATGPLIGTACTKPTAFDTNEAGLAIANQVGITGFTLHTNTTDHAVILTDSTGVALGANSTISFDLGSSGGSDGIHNPSTTGTFYARILTYTNDTTAAAYTSASPGAHSDDGGIALSTANQLTVSARVQEQLQFCVSTTTVNDATTTVAADCSAAFTGNQGTSVDLGVVDSSAVAVSPVSTTTNGNAVNGAAMVRTNAANGVSVTYFAEQGTGSQHLGTLRVTGATCTAGGGVTTDPCFNSNTTQTTITTGTESFGMTVGGVNCNATSTSSYSCAMASGTNKLHAVSNYTGIDATTYGTTLGFAWQESGAATQIASSTGPVDDETLMLRFAATASITTPTGQYGVTSTYIATAEF